MKDFKKSGGFGGSRGGDRGGRRDFGGRPSFGGNRGGDRGPRRDFGDRPQMHKATCSECAKMCEVPFRPTGEKPIYCSDCFGSKKGANDYGNKRDFAPRQSFNKPEARDNRIDDLKQDIEFMNVKLDRMMRAIESLRIAVPVTKEIAKPIDTTELKKALKKATPKKATKKVVKKAGKK